ncbi:MAG: immunoglobulin domain-containing protein [Anaerolineae bacterium]|nr:immunoglobulin domain-containing protein [Anaerolineae bacterium]
MKNKLSIWFTLFVCGIFLIPQMCQAAEIMNDDLDAGGTWSGNGWDESLSNWFFSTSGYGNPANYGWGGGPDAPREDIDSGVVSKDTGYAIQLNDLLSLSVDLKDLVPNELDGSILVTLYYLNGAVVEVIGSSEYHDDVIPAGWNLVGQIAALAPFDAVGKNLYVKFEGGPSSWNGTSAQRLGVDNIIINQETSLDALYVSPANGEIDVPESGVLTWEVARDPNNTANPHPSITGINLYLDPNEAAVTAGNASVLIPLGASVESYDPTPDLLPDSTYFWCIDIILSDADDIVGDVWSFDTVKTLPVVTQQPDDAYAFETKPAEITIVVSSQSTANYQWYKGEKGDTSTPVGTDPTLSFAGVILSDESPYWCRITNVVGSIDSEAGSLTVKRLMGHWKLDGDLTNELADGRDGSMTDPNYVAGIDGSALLFEADGDIVTIANSSDAYQTTSLTVSLFMKTGNTAASSGLIAQRVTTPSEIGWYMAVNGGAAFGELEGIGTLTDGSVLDNQWHMMTLQYNSENGEVSLYVDGEVKVRSGTTTPLAYAATPLLFGATGDGSTALYSGLIDDVRIYNYALTEYEVADLYATTSGEKVCFEYPQFDLTGPEGEPDCVVDMLDFAAFALEWMGCNLLPISNCQ